jgi:prepilin-type N-terminal cleavage/methylation domain-containing protein
MNKKHGYTLVELLIVIVVIGLISTIALLSYTNTQQKSRDSQRKVSAIIVSEALEEYYSRNGEYLAVSKMTAANATTPKNLLGLDNLDSFIAPRSASGTTTNIWRTGDASNTNKLTYSPNTDTTASCLTGSTVDDVCSDFKIQYYNENSATIDTILSRNKAVVPPVPPLPTTPATPTMTASLIGANAVGTSSTATCTGSASPEYALQSRTNDGAWSSFTAWSPTKTISTPAVQGVKYGFQVKARCIDGGLISAESAVSTEGTYIHPITTPATPTVTESTSGTISTFTWNTTVCPAGTTARYQYRFVADWGYTSPWYGPYTGLNSRTWDTESQGYQYTVQVQTHCYTAFDTSDWSGTGSDSYIRAVTGPTGVTFGISRYAPNVVHVSAGATCHSSVALHSRADPHTWDYLWLDTQVLGWYADSHNGNWTVNTWGDNGNPVVTGATNGSYGPFATNSRWNIGVDLMCKNSTTGRASATTGRLNSPVLYLPN